MDASRINSQLWTGAAISTADDVAWLVQQGISADVDCRAEFDDQSLIDAPNAAGLVQAAPLIAYLYAGVPDDGQPKPVSWFAGVWAFAQPIFTAGGVVLSHCAAGVNRGPSMALFLLMADWKLSEASAEAAIRAVRPEVGLAYKADAVAAIQAMGLS